MDLEERSLKMNRLHLRWNEYDNNGDILPDGYKRLYE